MKKKKNYPSYSWELCAVRSRDNGVPKDWNSIFLWKKKLQIMVTIYYFNPPLLRGIPNKEAIDSSRTLLFQPFNAQ